MTRVSVKNTQDYTKHLKMLAVLIMNAPRCSKQLLTHPLMVLRVLFIAF